MVMPRTEYQCWTGCNSEARPFCFSAGGGEHAAGRARPLFPACLNRQRSYKRHQPMAPVAVARKNGPTAFTMKTSLRIQLLLSLIPGLTGCVPMRYSDYTGHDASSYLGTWPVGPGTMAEPAHGRGLFTSGLAVPVYRGWPERQYLVLGSLRFDEPRKDWGYDEGILKDAASEAKGHGADAIIIRQGAEFGISQIAGARSNPFSVLSTFQTTALAIRWLTQREIEERRRLVDDYSKRFAAEQAAKRKTEFKDNPKIGANRTVAELVFTYLFVTDHDPKSTDLWDRFAETMTRLVAKTSENPAGVWIFKATASLSTIMSGGEGKNYLGLATVSADGESLTIVSSSGQIELNFNGTLIKGGLSGQLGFGSISAKCEGAITAEKISISFQSLTADGTLSGNVVLQRLPPQPNENELQRVPFEPKENEKNKPSPGRRG